MGKIWKRSVSVFPQLESLPTVFIQFEHQRSSIEWGMRCNKFSLTKLCDLRNFKHKSWKKFQQGFELPALQNSSYWTPKWSGQKVCLNFWFWKLWITMKMFCLCVLVVRVPGYRSRGPGFDSRRYQIIWEVGSLERGPLSLVRRTEELFEWRSNGSGSRKSRLTAVGIRCVDHATPSIRKSWH
jgi:hypothetical protein